MRVAAVTPSDMVFSDNLMMNEVEFWIYNREVFNIHFGKTIQTEAKIGNHWKEIPNSWMLNWIPRGKSSFNPPVPYKVTFFVPAEADTFRIRLKYYRNPNRRLPFGIGDPWSRSEATSLPAWRVQQIVRWISPKLYDWFWPVNFTHSPPKWREASITVSMPQNNLK